VALVVGAVCAVLAGLRWTVPRVVGPLRDVTTYGDGNPTPPQHRDSGAGLIDLLLGGAGLAVVLAVTGFVGIAMLRGRSLERRRPVVPAQSAFGRSAGSHFM
jgi:hypothetical protein